MTTTARVSANALTVFEKRYLYKHPDGRMESVEDLFKRVSATMAAVEYQYDKSDEQVAAIADEFYQGLLAFDFLPNSPCLANAGVRTGQLSACFVLGVPDDLAGIFETQKHMALIHQTGGGTGFCFSNLREEGALVASTQGVSSGPISYLDSYNAATETIKQGGMRRGANMATFRCDHPDILKFIRHKRDKSKLTNFNVSVLVTDAFMHAVKDGADYELVSPKTGATGKFLNARAVFKEMVEGGWFSGEPGCLYVDAANRTHPLRYSGATYEATNPCGEQWLDPYDSCNLGSINVRNFVKVLKHENPAVMGTRMIDWDRLRKAVRTYTRFLDNVIDANRYVLKQIEAVTKANRRIGLGVMGFADLLIFLGISYGSEESFQLAENLLEFITREAQTMSFELAKEKGCFPNWEISVYGPQGANIPMRNAATVTIAPTGTLSILADCSSGCEPLFAVVFMRYQADTLMPTANPDFEAIAKDHGFYSEDLMKRIAEHGTVQGMDEVPEWVQELFKTAHDLTPEQHVRMQAAFQRGGDKVGGMNSISKTINFAESATVAEVEQAYMLAWELGCKGITVYRDGSRNEQPLSTNATTTAKHNESKEAVVNNVINQTIIVQSTPDREFTGTTNGRKVKVKTPHGTMHVYLGRNDKGELVEVISSVGKNGGIPQAEAEAISRLVSLMLRKGMEKEVIDQLRGISTGQVAFDQGKMIYGTADAIAQVIEEEVYGRVEKIRIKDAGNHNRACPECSGTMEFGGGCFTCPSCGYSKCA